MEMQRPTAGKNGKRETGSGNTVCTAHTAAHTAVAVCVGVAAQSVAEGHGRVGHKGGARAVDDAVAAEGGAGRGLPAHGLVRFRENSRGSAQADKTWAKNMEKGVGGSGD